jgi:hypothetical protein
MHHPTTQTSLAARRLLSSCIHVSPSPFLRPTGFYLRQSNLIAPQIRGVATSTSLPKSHRAISTSSVAQVSPSSVAQSTALLEQVKQAETSREAEDKVGQKLQEGGKGAEGAHYKGSFPFLLSRSAIVLMVYLTWWQYRYDRRPLRL